MEAADFVGQMLRVEHAEPAASTQKEGFQVGGGTERQLEVGMVVGAGHDALRVVQRQVAQCELLAAEGAQHDALGLGAVAHYHAVALAEEVLGIEILVDGEGLGGDGGLKNAVEGEDAVLTVGKPSEEVPSLVKELQTVGCHDVALGLVGKVAAVVELHAAVTSHGLQNLLQQPAVGGDVFQEYALLHAETPADDVADGEGRQEPVLHAVLLQHMLVAYIITVRVMGVALYEEAKHLLDGILMAQEGGARHGQPTAHLLLYPQFVELAEGEPTA